MGHYERTLPRDLFNEADLLKCYGRLWILLQGRDGETGFLEETVDQFVIGQDEGSGDTTVENLTFRIAGRAYGLYRPLNARSPWPLWLSGKHLPEDIRVFDDLGALSPDMLKLLGC